MKNLLSILRGKKGAFSILYLIITFIAIILAVGFSDMLVRSYTIEEVQSNMDIAGVSSLQTGIDNTKLRVQQFDVNKNVVESNYKKLVSERLDDSTQIDSFKFVRTEVKVFNGKFGLGQTTKQRPQALIDSTMVIVVNNSQMFDLIPGSYRSYYNSYDNSYFDVNYLGKNEDGNS